MVCRQRNVVATHKTKRVLVGPSFGPTRDESHRIGRLSLASIHRRAWIGWRSALGKSPKTHHDVQANQCQQATNAKPYTWNNAFNRVDIVQNKERPV